MRERRRGHQWFDGSRPRCLNCANEIPWTDQPKEPCSDYCAWMLSMDIIVTDEAVKRMMAWVAASL